MSTHPRHSLLRSRDGHHAQVGPVELFFDLVFVFAVTQLSHHQLAHMTPYGALETLILFLGVWWLWIYTSWAMNWLDPERVRVRLLVFALMAAVFVLALSIGEAWGDKGLTFALAYVFIQVGRSFFMVCALHRHDPVLHRGFIRITAWLAAAGAFWIAGGLAEPENRMWFWVVALTIEYAAAPIGFWLPGLGRSSTTDWNIEGGHMAERVGLFIIIALGESIIVTGSTLLEAHWDVEILLAFVSAFVATIAMWWLYFNVGAVRGSDRISAEADPGRFARLAYTYMPLPIIAGILMSAAADELVLAHPHGHLGTMEGLLIVGGPLLFLAGNLMFKRTTARHFPLSHLVAISLLLIMGGLAIPIGPLAASLAGTAALLVAALWETVTYSAWWNRLRDSGTGK